MKNESNGSGDIKDILRETDEMIKKMNVERARCFEFTCNEPESEELRRIATRTLFSIIEGMCYRMKITALRIGLKYNVGFSPEEIAKLKEERFFRGENGKVKKNDFWLPIKDNIKFTFKMFARAMASNFELELEKSKGWNFLIRAVDIRHRITHPKELSSLTVTKYDLDCVKRGYNWFVARLRKLSKSIPKERPS